MSQNNKLLSFLGLAQKAGKVASGEFSTEKAVKSGTASLVIVSEDASNNTKKKFTNMCDFYKVPICIIGTKEELGQYTGKNIRASLALTDQGFAKSFLKKLNDQTNMEV